jgi:hypothetical protein
MAVPLDELRQDAGGPVGIPTVSPQASSIARQLRAPPLCPSGSGGRGPEAEETLDYARIRKDTDKIVCSRTLEAPTSARTPWVADAAAPSCGSRPACLAPCHLDFPVRAVERDLCICGRRCEGERLSGHRGDTQDADDEVGLAVRVLQGNCWVLVGLVEWTNGPAKTSAINMDLARVTPPRVLVKDPGLQPPSATEEGSTPPLTIFLTTRGSNRRPTCDRSGFLRSEAKAPRRCTPPSSTRLQQTSIRVGVIRSSDPLLRHGTTGSDRDGIPGQPQR